MTQDDSTVTRWIVCFMHHFVSCILCMQADGDVIVEVGRSVICSCFFFFFCFTWLYKYIPIGNMYTYDLNITRAAGNLYLWGGGAVGHTIPVPRFDGHVSLRIRYKLS